MTKLGDLDALAETDQYHIVGVTESWINTEYRDFIAQYSAVKE